MIHRKNAELGPKELQTKCKMFKENMECPSQNTREKCKRRAT